MRIGFLGHNGFALGDQNAPVLVDPILFSRYGEEYTSSPVEIYPPRTIRRDLMPTPAAVIISHEHSDHFHLPSLDTLDRSVPIVVGPNMISKVTECVEALGFEVVRLPFGEDRQFGSCLITLYPPSGDTVLWESRVSQVYARDAADPELGGYYICIDALMSETFLAEMESGEVPAPTTIGVSNNAQVTPPGVFGSLDSFQGTGHSQVSEYGLGFGGLEVVYGLVAETIALSAELRGVNVMICGGGFLKDYEEMGPFPFSEQKQVAAAAQRLVRNMRISGPEPGDIVEADADGITPAGELTWLATDRDRFAMLIQRRQEFLAGGSVIPMKRIAPADPQIEAAAREQVRAGLPYLEKVFLLAPLGRAFVTTGHARPLVLKTNYEYGPDLCFFFDIAAGRFVESPALDDDALFAEHPYGMIVNGVDLAAVFTGELQLWDIVGIAMRAWFEGEKLDSPVAVMFDAYGEQIRPDISCKVYDQQLSMILEGQRA
jgi:hypothetical protein